MSKRRSVLALIAILCAMAPTCAAAEKPWWDIFGGLRQLITGPRGQKFRVLSRPESASIWVGNRIVSRATPAVVMLNAGALSEVVVRSGSRQMRVSACRHVPPKDDVDMLDCVFP